MVKAQLEKKKKREAEEADDYLKNVELGGRDFVIADIEKDKKKEKTAADKFLNDLQTKKLYRVTYRRKLADELREKVSAIDFPNGWQYDTLPTSDNRQITIYGQSFKTKQGIILVLKSPKGEVFIRAVRTCYKPEVDFKAMRILAVQAENTVDSDKGILLSDKKVKKTKSGIYLP